MEKRVTRFSLNLSSLKLEHGSVRDGDEPKPRGRQEVSGFCAVGNRFNRGTTAGLSIKLLTVNRRSIVFEIHSNARHHRECSILFKALSEIR